MNSIRHVCAHNEAVVSRKLVFAQPPSSTLSLFGSALRIYTKMVHNLARFELTPDTTYEHYVHASESLEVVDVYNLLPPEFPEVRIWFRYDHLNFEEKFHRDCPGAGAWHMEMCHPFSNVFAAVRSFANAEETYWCHYCRRGLFSQLMSRSFTCKQLNMENC